MIEKLLNYFGYIKVSSVLKDIPMLNAIDMATMQDSLAQVPHFNEYLDATLSADIQRYVSAMPEDHKLIRGAMGRTRHFKNLVTQNSQKAQHQKNGFNLSRYH